MDFVANILYFLPAKFYTYGCSKNRDYLLCCSRELLIWWYRSSKLLL